MVRRRTNGRRCGFESLEDRRLLAGDVTAKIDHGDLVIKGDGAANGITITAGSTAGTVVITGVNAGGSATNVNGTANGTVTLSGFTDDLKIKLKGGDDLLTITGPLTVPDDADIDTGDGNDTVTITSLTVNDDLDLDLGKGDDAATLTTVTTTDKADIDTSRGADNVTITGSTFNKLDVEMGRNDDNLTISNTTVHKETDLDGGKGTNLLKEGSGNSLGDLDIDDFNVTTNTTPTVDINTISPITENSTATLTGSFTDKDTTDTHTVTVDWADSNNSTDSTFAVPAIGSLSVNQTINSTSGDNAVLTITAVNTTTGQVTFSVQHKYADDGVSPGNNTTSDNSVITVTVNDNFGGSGNDTTTLTVNNVAPAITLNAVNAITENNTATLTGSFTDIGVSDVHTMTVNWGDPNKATNSTFTVPATSGLTANQTITSSSGDGTVLTITAVNTTTGQVSFSVQHKYADDGVSPGNNTASDTNTLSVTIADDDTGSDTKTTTVTVNNSAPALVLNAVSAITENGTATLTGNFTDIGLSDVHTMTVNWGDPNKATNSTFTVPATSGLTANQTITSSSGDGTVLTITAVNTPTGVVTFSVSHKYTDDGVSPGNNTASDTSTISVTVADDDTGSDTKTTTVTINNSAPSVVLNAVTAINENSSATLTGNFTDIGLSDVHTVTINWGDPNNSTNSTFTVPATSGLAANQTINSTSGDGAVLTLTAVNTATGQVTFSVQHKYLDDGPSPNSNGTASDTSTITVTVADDDTGSDVKTTTVQVNNVAPSIVLNPVTSISEHGAATLTGSYTDIGLLDAHLLSLGWGDPNNATNSSFLVPAIQNAAGTATLTTGQTITSTTGDGAVLTIGTINATTGQVAFSVQHTYADDGVAPGNNTASDVSTITAAVTDDDNGSANTTTTVTVNNVIPAIALNAVAGINENGTATLSGSFTDIGLLDQHTLTVNWGDPNNATNSTFSLPATNTLTASQTFNSTSGDGAVLLITAVNPGTGQVSYSVQHKYTDDGLSPGNATTSDSSTITVTVSDDDTGSTNTTTTVLVSNVAPSVSLDAIQDINENETATLTGSFTDIGLADAHTLTVDWDDPNNATNSTFSLPKIGQLSINQTFPSSTDGATLTITALNAVTGQVSFSVQHQYRDDGAAPGNNSDSDVSDIVVTVADDDGGSGNDSTPLTVHNIAPAVALDPISDISENDSATVTGTFTDAGLLDGHSVTVDWGDPNNIFAITSQFTLPAIFDSAGTQTLHVNDTFSSPTDGATLTVTSVNTATGQVGFSVAAHQYLDDGPTFGNGTENDTSTINVTVTDDDQQNGSDSTTVTVHNVAPNIILDPVADISENGTATVTGKFTDVGRLDGHTINIDWDDPNNSVESTFTLDPVLNVFFVPTLNPGDTFTSPSDGAVLTVTSVNAITGEVGFSVSHQYLDDGLEPGNATASDTSTISVTVDDDDTGSDNDTTNVIVNNASPILALDALSNISENGTATLTGTYSDVGTLDEHTLTVDWDDPNNSVDSTFAIGAIGTLAPNDTINSSTDSAVLTITSVDTSTGQIGFSVDHQYTDDGLSPGNGTSSDTSTITVTVDDDDLGSDTETTSVTVDNVAPEISNPADTAVDERSEVTLTATITDPGTQDVFSVDVDWQDSTQDTIPNLGTSDIGSTTVGGTTYTWTAATRQLTLKHTYLDDDPTATASDIKAVTLTPHDDDLGTGATQTVNVTVNNVQPTVALDLGGAFDVNTAATLTGSFTDVGIFDSHTLVVDWDDASNVSTFALSPTVLLAAAQTINSSTDGAVLTITSVDTTTGTVGFSVQHTYTSTGNFTVTVTVDDDDLGSGLDTTVIGVVDPND